MNDLAYSLALLEIGNLTPALMVADHCLKAAGVRLLGIESSDSADQCIKLVGRTADVTEASRAGVELARRMGTARPSACSRPRRRAPWRTRCPFTVPCWASMITESREMPR